MLATTTADTVLTSGDGLDRTVVYTPGGPAWAICVHEVPNGATVSEDGVVTVNGAVVETIGPCPFTEPPPG